MKLVWIFLTTIMLAAMSSARRLGARSAFTAVGWSSRQSRTAKTSLSAFQQGDHVEIEEDGTILQGTIREVRGAGWYSIQIQPTTNDGSGGENDDIVLRKFRASQLELLTKATSSEAVTSKITATSVDLLRTEGPAAMMLPPPPTIIDLDSAANSLGDHVEQPRDAAYLEQVRHHLSFSRWVVFTDLHCAPASLTTCLEVLKHVHQLAVEQNAGVMFLGDFWHHRGTIRVDTLNSVLGALSEWTQPLVMIPGNHDQVTLGGANHGLTPLQYAYRCKGNPTIPGPLIFSHPTVFGDALFVPHMRDNAVMESVLQSSSSKEAAAIFCHADVTGASMNDLIVSHGGVSPRFFPPNIPIYSGHFHKPHLVTRSAADICIEYIGSPYETSLAEAHQDKQLLLLDAKQGWDCIKRFPISLGRKHFRVDSVDDLVATQAKVRDGDRVVVTIPKEDLNDLRRLPIDTLSDFDIAVTELRKEGVAVEIREVKAVPLRAMGPGDVEDTQQLEELTPAATLTSYFLEEVDRESMSNTTSQELLRVGMQLLDELDADETPTTSALTDMQLMSVSLEGFGPFKEHTTYPLYDRGLVLLRGSNKDGGSDSNGTGKSSLAMATLWALTGSVDPRLVSDGKVADVVTDGCKTAKVVVQGQLNGKDFRITRTKTSSKTGLVFFLGGEDLTTQSARDTQDVIEETLGIDLQVLGRTVFHGQHAVNGLLEATDVKFKDELAYVVPLDIWQRAATLARTRGRNAGKEGTELKGMIRLREEDLKDLEMNRDQAQKKAADRLAVFEEKRSAFQKQEENVADPMSSVKHEIPKMKARVEESDEKLNAFLFKLEEQKQTRDEQVSTFRLLVEEQSRQTIEATAVLQASQRDVDRASLRDEMAEKSLQDIAKKWNTVLTVGIAPTFVVENCPTCLQPLSDEGVGHSHSDLAATFQEEADAAFVNKQEAKQAALEATESFAMAKAAVKDCETGLKRASDDLQKLATQWAILIENTEIVLDMTRSNHAQLSFDLSEAYSSLQSDAEAEARKATLEAERSLLENVEEQFNQIQNDFDRAQASLYDMKVKAEEQRSLSSILSGVSEAFGAKGVQNFVLQNAIEALQTISQGYLDELSDGSIKLSLSLDVGDKIARRAFVRLPNGDFTERPLSSLSGGQWRRCSLALSFGFMDLISRRGRLRPSLLVMDEPLTHLDRSGRTLVGSLLRKLLTNGESIGQLGNTGISAGTIILILQDLAAEEIEEAFDHIDEVQKKDGFSKLVVDERS